MDTKFKSLEPELIQDNIFKLIGSDWMLVCSGNKQNYNMMTASWGCCGVLWNKPIAITFIRPQRYTFDFVEKNEFFTLNFFDESFRKTLNVLGKNSGRDLDKMNIEELDVTESENKTVFFNQARIVLECRKLYFDDLKPALFLDAGISKMYPQNDYHRFYIGEIVNSMLAY